MSDQATRRYSSIRPPSAALRGLAAAAGRLSRELQRLGLAPDRPGRPLDFAWSFGMAPAAAYDGIPAPTTYPWDFGDRETATHTFRSPGVDRVTVDLTDAGGLSGQRCVTVKVARYMSQQDVRGDFASQLPAARGLARHGAARSRRAPTRPGLPGRRHPVPVAPTTEWRYARPSSPTGAGGTRSTARSPRHRTRRAAPPTPRAPRPSTACGHGRDAGEQSSRRCAYSITGQALQQRRRLLRTSPSTSSSALNPNTSSSGRSTFSGRAPASSRSGTR